MRDIGIEHWLDTKKVEWDYVEEIHIDRIVVDATAQANIRLNMPLDQDNVRGMVVSLRDNGRAQTTLPAIIVYEVDGNYGLVNGLHRREACDRASVPTLDAYVLDIPDRDMRVIDGLRRTVNILNGIPPSREEALQHAFHLVHDSGWTQKDAAASMLIDYELLKTEFKSWEVAQDLEEHGIDSEKLNKAQRLKLAPIKMEFRAEIAKLLLEARLSADQLSAVVSEVQVAKDTDEAKNIIAHWRRIYNRQIVLTDGGKKAFPSSPLTSLPAAMARAKRFMAVTGVAALTLPEVDNIIASVKEHIKGLQGVVRRLEKYKRENA